ncbi:cell cycle checkpoint control protein RAD9B [Pelodytes ibericus]
MAQTANKQPTGRNETTTEHVIDQTSKGAGLVTSSAERKMSNVDLQSVLNICIVWFIAMKCVIPCGHLKVFGKAILSLSKIGDELWFDPVENGLALRVVNSARSAYACILFSSFFFLNYQKAVIHEHGQGEVLLQIRCKLSVKSVLPMFRSLSTLDRNVDKCSIYMDFNNCRVIFHWYCKHGITKTHNLIYEECEPLQAAFNKNTCPNALKIQSRILSDVIIHFPTCQEEVTLTITPLKVSIKSYNEEAMGFSKAMHTEIHLSRDEFNYFQVGVDSEITFCLKELRGFLAFAETISACVSVHFGQPGRPVAFSMDDVMFEANFILATLEQSESKNVTQTSPYNIVGSNLATPRSYVGKEKSDKRKPGNQSRKQRTLLSHSPAFPNIPGNTQEKAQLCKATGEPSNPSSYNEFCSMFFGAMSSQNEHKFDQVIYSLATASEDEEDEFCRPPSQTF